MKNINATLNLIIQQDKILLGEKKRGFAKGTLNGVGGKQEENETIDQTMIRETQEEIGVTPVKFDQVGVVNFDTPYKGERIKMNVYIYVCNEYEGTPIETEEIKPYWFELGKIPYDRMLSDDLMWMCYVLENKKFQGTVKFNDQMEVEFSKFNEIEKGN